VDNGAEASHKKEPDMIKLKDQESMATIAELSEDDLKQLVDALEEESGQDQDYYIDSATLHFLAESGLRKDLLKQLGAALGEREGMEVVWVRD
jgi:alpha/beta superfamily hydrolase